MKIFHLLPATSLAAAFVVPDQHVFQQLSIEPKHRVADTVDDVVRAGNNLWDSIKSGSSRGLKKADCHGKKVKAALQSTLDEGLAAWHDVGSKVTEEFFDAQSWVEKNLEDRYDAWEERGPHHGPPHDGPHHGPPHDGPPRHGGPHHGPPHRGHHEHKKPNQTVYELIASSKYTTKLAELINDYPDIVKALNGTAHNYTVFAPVNRAFEKIPEHAPKPSKEFLLKILSYHVSPDFYPAGRVLVTHTVPTLLKGENLSESGENAQRLTLGLGLKGLEMNHYARVVGIDFFGTNGVIHAVDSILLPPPPATKILQFLPGEFSTLTLALDRTGLLEEFAKPHSTGGTLFAPSNFAFKKLGPRINAFLFSDYGRKYLKALLEYHVVPKIILYSDAVYNVNETDSKDHKRGGIPKGLYHIDLPTLLEDKSLSVDIFRFGGFIPIKINGFARVIVEDGVAADGVIQVVGDVLIPPKKLPGGAVAAAEPVIEDMDLDDFKSRFEGLV